MFRKKPIYWILLVFFVLLLAAETTLFCIDKSRTTAAASNQNGAFSGTLPEDFSGTMPEDFAGTMPEDFSGTLPEGFDGTMPSGGFGKRDTTTETTANDVFWTVVEKAFWPVLIGCVVCIGLCIMALILVTRAQKRNAPQEPEAEEPSSDKPKRKTHKALWISVLALVLAVAIAIAVLPEFVQTQQAEGTIEAVESILDGTAQEEDLSALFYGSGTLAASDADTVTIPSGVTVKAFTVQNGDVVAVGDVVATVDATSVLQTIASAQAMLDTLDAALEEAAGDTIPTTVTAHTAGRVKAIYAEAGQSVTDVMYQNGALLLLSLDGMMAVDVETDAACSVGDAVAVILSNGTVETGKIVKIRDGVVTATLTDAGTAYGDTVSVAAEDGTTLGSGTLYIHSELKITGYSGTISKVSVQEDAMVKVGATLFTLTDTAYLAEYQSLMKTRATLTEQMTLLSTLRQTGYVTATAAGIVSGIDETAAYAPLADTEAAAYAATEGNGTTILGSMPSSGVSLLQILREDETPTPTAEPGETEEPSTGGSCYAGVVKSIAYGSITLQVTANAVDGLDLATLAAMDTSTFVIVTKITPALDVPVYRYSEGVSQTDSIDNLTAGVYVLVTFSGATVTRIDYVAAQSTQPGGGSGGGSFGGGSFGGASAQEPTVTIEALAEVTVCSVTPNDAMTISMSVDELDVLSLAVGQQASVTLDAISGQRFSGEVTSLDPIGVNAGGGTKYTVVLTIVRTEQMLTDMNASVQIEVSTQRDALVIPAAAVYEDGSAIYVYTGYDEKTDTLTDPVSVTVGASDGVNVQITAGLSAGDAFYYRYADALTYTYGS